MTEIPLALTAFYHESRGFSYVLTFLIAKEGMKGMIYPLAHKM